MRSYGRVLWCLVLVMFAWGCSSDINDCWEFTRLAEENCALQDSVAVNKAKAACDECLKREEVAKAEAAKVPTCDRWLEVPECMQQACPFDSVTTFSSRKPSEVEILRAEWRHVEYGVDQCRWMLDEALNDADNRYCSGWDERSSYSREVVQAKRECFETEYNAAARMVLSYPGSLPQDFAALGSNEGPLGFAPRLKTMQIYFDYLMEDNTRLEASGITPPELKAWFQRAFAEALVFLEEARRSGDKDLADEIEDHLCVIISSDEQPYSLYPHEPVSGKTRAQVAIELQCPPEG